MDQIARNNEKCRGRNLKFSKLVCIILLLVSALPSCRQKIDGLGIELTLDKKTLSNGLTVILVEDHTVPVITYQTWYKVGSVDEQPGITGISHLFEHLMFKGTEKYGPKQFFQQLEAKGAEVNAFTTRDYTVYYESFTPELLEKVIDMESDRMGNLKLDEEVLNTERQVVLEERRLKTDNSVSGKMQEALWALAYRRHPYRWPVVGYVEDLLSIQVPRLQDYLQTYYQPGNATLVLVGDFNPGSTFDLIQKYYNKVSGHARPQRKIEPEPAQNEEHRFVLHDEVASEQFAQAYHVTAAVDEDSYALDVLANILFEGSSSRAYRKLVEEKDIAISVSGSAFTPAFPGIFIITGTMKGNIPAEQGEVLLDQVIRETQEKGVSGEEISAAVKQLTVQLVDSVRTPFGLGQLIGTVMMIFGEPTRFAEDLSKYLKVTAQDVKRVSVKYLSPNNRSVVTLLPEVKKKSGTAK